MQSAAVKIHFKKEVSPWIFWKGSWEIYSLQHSVFPWAALVADISDDYENLASSSLYWAVLVAFSQERYILASNEYHKWQQIVQQLLMMFKKQLGRFKSFEDFKKYYVFLFHWGFPGTILSTDVLR